MRTTIIWSSPIKGRNRGNCYYVYNTIYYKCFLLLLVTTTGLICCGLGLNRGDLQYGSLGALMLCEGLLLGTQHRVAPTRNHGCNPGSGNPFSVSPGFSRPKAPASNRRLLLDDSGDDYGSDFDAKALSNRIQQIKDSESDASEKFTSGLEQRVQELRSANAIEEQFDGNDDGNDDNLASPLLSLPVICFDALLPNQKLEGSTEDSTFIRFLLEETGLGGWFVMTSFEYRSRKVRRNGVLCKVEFLDAAASTKKLDGTTTAIRNDSNKTRWPTSVEFVIVGKRRCCLAGKKEGLESRIGRWRRVYDENGEESVLGWGMERFTDELPSSEKNGDRVLNKQSSVSSSSIETETEAEVPMIKDPKQWSASKIELLRFDGDYESSSSVDPVALDKAESLVPLLEEWQDLASNPDTYRNTNVTASVRAQRNQPFLRVDPEALLKHAMAELGDRPDPRTEPTRFCYWGAALINPLPALGVSIEIRGNILEVRTLEERLTILEAGLVRSIQNLKGERSL